MNIKKTTLAVAVSALVGMGISGQAAANAYAGSSLKVTDLSLLITEDGTNPSDNVTVTSFSFSILQTSALNGNDAIGTASCSGLPGTPSATTNNCNPVSNTGVNTPNTILDENPANAPTSDVARDNNDFTLMGPGTDQFSNSDSVIYTAQLTAPGVTFTSTEQIAESELQPPPTNVGDPNPESAAANSEIQSITGFTMTFTVDGAANNELILDFDADPYLRSFISDETVADSGASMNVTFLLEKFDNEGNKIGDVAWAPDGEIVAGDCEVSDLVGITCAEDNDDRHLNDQVGLTANGDNTQDDAIGNFGITVSGLSNTDPADPDTGETGNYTLTLFQKVSTVVNRRNEVAVPEPAALSLLGAGLFGIAGFHRRRRRNQA